VTTPAPAPTTDPGTVAGSCERTLPGYPVLDPGAKGAAVRALQCFLNDGGYGPVAVDGVYGAQTRAAVKKVEASFDGPRPTPGRIDASLWVLLISRSLGTGTLTVGSKGAEVVTLQRALRAAGGTLTVDGVFGAETKKVVQRFQQANRVGDDGVVGDETRFLLKMGATIG
jgi:peptidoglycan hydrolase-like protein with peptidoglycan-binding domain